MIKAVNIHKSYDQVEILKGVDLHIKEKEIVSIVGASGAGKTTLLQILGTLDKPTIQNSSTALYIDQTNVLGLKDKELSAFRNLNLGFIFQFHQLLPEFTALENILLPGMIARKNTDQLTKKAKELLDYLGLSDKATNFPSQLSGGEQQRIAVARAMINDPKVIFADEPSGNLDKHSAQNLHQLFFKLRDELGQTFVIVTHNEELALMADRKLTMVDGNIIQP